MFKFVGNVRYGRNRVRICGAFVCARFFWFISDMSSKMNTRQIIFTIKVYLLERQIPRAYGAGCKKVISLQGNRFSHESESTSQSD